MRNFYYFNVREKVKLVICARRESAGLVFKTARGISPEFALKMDGRTDMR